MPQLTPLNREQEHPHIDCPRLPALDLNDWDAVAAALRDVPVCPLQQSWLPAPHPSFRPASVRTGYTANDLVVFAELHDDDIFNPVTTFNEMAFGHGDVFEMFLRAEDEIPYYEFHVSPRNQQLQLRFPTPEAWRTPAKVPGSRCRWLIDEPVMRSQVRVDAGQQRWWVQALIPRTVVGNGDQWRFSFSRYDYTRGQAGPVTSSTSSHAAVNFHNQAEWGTLAFL